MRIIKLLLCVVTISYPLTAMESFREHLSKLDKSQYRIENTPFFRIDDEQMHEILVIFFTHEKNKEKLEFDFHHGDGKVTVFPYEDNNFLTFSWQYQNSLCSLILGIRENKGSLSAAKINETNSLPTPLDPLAKNIVVNFIRNVVTIYIIKTFES